MCVCVCTGAESQILPTVMRVDISMELPAAPVGADGLSPSQYAVALGCVPHVFQVSMHPRPAWAPIPLGFT